MNPTQHDTLPIGRMAHELVGSEILRLANDIRRLRAEGVAVADFTVGDFQPAHFPIPEALTEAIVAQYRAGATNYPPAMGVPELRQALADWHRMHLGLEYSPDEILVAGGARPLIYGIYATVLDPGDTVVYGVPSWNNNHYCHIVGARKVQVAVSAAQNFLLTAADLAPHVDEAVLVALNSPLNPTGTMYDTGTLRELSALVLEENHRREAQGRKPCYILYDHIYWQLAYGRAHHHPLQFFPELRPYVLFVDGISKSLAATGVRVGWTCGPREVVSRMSNVLGHLGAWAPKPEQLATAEYLQAPAATHEVFRRQMDAGIQARLEALHTGIQQLKNEGLAVDSIAPQGGIYLSVQLDYVGRTQPDGTPVADPYALYQYLLQAARVAMVPFFAFGVDDPRTGWCRFSMGAVALDDIPAAVARMAQALRQLQ